MARPPRQFSDKSRTKAGQKTNSDKFGRSEKSRDQGRNASAGAGHEGRGPGGHKAGGKAGRDKFENKASPDRFSGNPRGRHEEESGPGPERDFTESRAYKAAGSFAGKQGGKQGPKHGVKQRGTQGGKSGGHLGGKSGGNPEGWLENRPDRAFGSQSGGKARGRSGGGRGGKSGMNIYEKRAASPSNLIYGVHAVTEAWLNPRRVITKFWATEKAFEEFQEILIKARKAGVNRPEADIIERSQFEARTKLDDNAVHQGLCIRCEALPEVFLDDALIRGKAAKAACFVILDQVTDPHNVGAIMRSACAFGAGAVIMQTRNAPNMTGVLAKAACGAAEHIPAIYVTNLSRAIEACKEHGFTVFGLDERGEDVLGAFEAPSHNVIVLGAEGKGLRPLVREHCDRVVRLPTLPPIGSLNVSNAAAVSLYALAPKGS